MTLKGVVFLAAYTARSQAYAQAMTRQNLAPETVVFFGRESSDLSKDVGSDQKLAELPGLFLPDLSIPLTRTVSDFGWSFCVCTASTVNDPQISELLDSLNPRLVIYSGYGGDIVRRSVLDLGYPFLHLHSGWLPNYRGSTTLYFSWLEKGSCAVSALLLDENIDTGPVVARKSYLLPPGGVDVDYLYDNAIRADLLVDVLKTFASQGELPLEKTENADATTYYIIHPVLKHIALLSSSSNSWAGSLSD